LRGVFIDVRMELTVINLKAGQEVGVEPYRTDVGPSEGPYCPWSDIKKVMKTAEEILKSLGARTQIL
jgi:hypothetical protein